MKKNDLLKHLLMLALSFSVLLITSCGEDDEDEPTTDVPTASFQFTVDETDFLKVAFVNVSSGADSYSWDFGDGSGTSTDENPEYTYSEPGTYTVTLTATNAAGSDDYDAPVTVSDPEAAAKLLHGGSSRTWKLIREKDSVSMAQLGTNGTWEGNKNGDGTRPCLYEQTFTFTSEGDYIFDDMGAMWGEWNEFQGDPRLETCIDVSGGTFEIGGNDVSAWLSGTHSYEYDAINQKLTLNGKGAWIGIPALGTSERHTVSSLPDSKTMDISITEYPDAGYDVMTIVYEYAADNIYWQFKFASYYNAADEPPVQDGPPACEPLAAVSPTEISHTFASNETSEWVLMQLAESGAGLELGVEDPTDATVKVGKYIRNAGVEYQELQFKLDPANAINFENMSTITMDVYLPSSNDYSGTLTDNVFVGFGATNCPPNWWEDQHEYQAMAVEKDQWVTLTFNLTDPAYVAKPDNGATVKDRNDLDMIYIAIGGAGHTVGGEFYMKNFSIK